MDNFIYGDGPARAGMRRPIGLFVLVFLVGVGLSALLSPTTVRAEPMQTPAATYLGGFADLAAALGDGRVGTPITPELPGDEPESVVQVTTAGAFYWSPQHAPTFFEPATSHRFALLPTGVLDWVGESLDPPPPPVAVDVDGPTGWPIGGALGRRIYCIEEIESTHGRAMYNPVPVGREHAQGWLGFLPSTALSVGAVIGNRSSEWQGAAHMLTNGRGAEFAGVAWGRC